MYCYLRLKSHDIQKLFMNTSHFTLKLREQTYLISRLDTFPFCTRILESTKFIFQLESSTTFITKKQE